MPSRPPPGRDGRRDGPLDPARGGAAVHASQKRQGQLQHALESRIVIEQAKGILAERYGLNMDDAFSRLRRTARSSRRPIHQVAAEIVAG